MHGSAKLHEFFTMPAADERIRQHRGYGAYRSGMEKGGYGEGRVIAIATEQA